MRIGYVALCITLFLLMMSTVVVFGKEDEEANAQETAQAHPGATTSATTTPEANNPSQPGTVLPPQYANGDAAAGKDIFATKGCATCHTLKAAGATGTIGPNLDEAKPSEALIADRVVNGKGAMPPFKTQLSDKQIADVVAYVYQSTQSG